MKCFICHDENIDLLKICICKESLICKECYKIFHNNVNYPYKCQICRRKLTVTTKLDYCNIIINLFMDSMIYIIMTTLHVGLPITIYYYSNDILPNNYFINKKIFLIFSILTIIFYDLYIGILFRYNMFNLKNNVQFKIMNIIYIGSSVYHLIFYMLVYFINENNIKFYFMFITLSHLFVLVIPSIIILYLYDQVKLFKKILKKYSKYTIKINKVLKYNNSNNNLNETIV